MPKRKKLTNAPTVSRKKELFSGKEYASTLADLKKKIRKVSSGLFQQPKKLKRNWRRIFINKKSHKKGKHARSDLRQK
jgi:hypothetical protein